MARRFEADKLHLALGFSSSLSSSFFYSVVCFVCLSFSKALTLAFSSYLCLTHKKKLASLARWLFTCYCHKLVALNLRTSLVYLRRSFNKLESLYCAIYRTKRVKPFNESPQKPKSPSKFLSFSLFFFFSFPFISCHESAFIYIST